MHNSTFSDRFILPLKILILVLTGSVIFGALILPISSRPSSYQISVGSVAAYDIVAPKNLTYSSTILTEQKKQQIEQSIQPIYLPIDPTISRHQIDKLRKAFNFINLIRKDQYTALNIKVEDLSKLNNIELDKDSAELILEISDEDWVKIQQESITVLEQSLRNSIRDYQVNDAIRKIQSLISYSFSESDSALIEKFVSPFIIENSLFSDEHTQEAVADALAESESIERSFSTGEIIVRRGTIITELSYEALDAFDLIDAQDKDQVMLSAGLFSIILTVLSGFYFTNRPKQNGKTIKELLVFSILLLIFLFAGKFLIPNRTILPFIFPIAAFALAIGTLFSFELSIFLTFILTIALSYDMPNFGELIVFFMLPSIIGTLVLGQGRRLSIFFLSGLIVGAVGASVIVSLRLLTNQTDTIGILTLALASLINGIASASLALLIQYILAQVLGITTAIQLLEIARPDHPLLQFLLNNAPGTYQHSLQVANLAEQAAKKIGADQLLTRVGAIYHDVGKSMNPTFFIENQVDGATNPHNSLDPYTSASTVIAHVTDGVHLAKKYRLPMQIQDFILEHHGTLSTKYFYVKAVENSNSDDEVDIADFQYPGPAPQSKETALMMLADGCEAKARAEKPQSREAIEILINQVIQGCQSSGQLKNTDLTLRDLTMVAESFANTLVNTYHPRIKYPELKKKTENEK